MSMSRGLVAAATMALFLPGGASQGQEMTVEAWEELRGLQSEIREDRKAIVEANLPLTASETKAFWPVYAEYREAADAVADRMAGLIEAYAANVDQMNDVKADAFFQEWLSIEREDLETHEKFAGKVRKVLPGRKAIRFFQIESKLDAIMRLDITMRVPLVE